VPALQDTFHQAVKYHVRVLSTAIGFSLSVYFSAYLSACRYVSVCLHSSCLAAYVRPTIFE